QRVLRLRGGFCQRLPGSLRGGGWVWRKLGGDPLAVSDRVGLHLQEIHDAAEACLCADREPDGRDGVAKRCPYWLLRPIEAADVAPAQAVDGLGGEEHRLHQRRLPRAAVSGDGDVADTIRRIWSHPQTSCPGSFNGFGAGGSIASLLVDQVAQGLPAEVMMEIFTKQQHGPVHV